MPPDTNVTPRGTWDVWAKKVLSDIERIDKQQQEILEVLNGIRVEMAVQKTKLATIAGIWGAIIGAGASLIVAIIAALVNHASKAGGYGG
jgi:hypothetical protein